MAFFFGYVKEIDDYGAYQARLAGHAVGPQDHHGRSALGTTVRRVDSRRR